MRAAGRAVRLGGVRHCAAGSRRELGEPRRSEWCRAVVGPKRFPPARARFSPARVRSRIMSTSNSLNTPIIWNKGLAGRRRGVDRLLMETEVDPGAADLAEETDKVRVRSSRRAGHAFRDAGEFGPRLTRRRYLTASCGLLRPVGRMVDPLIVDDVCGLFALGPAAPWDGRLCTNAQGASFRMVDVKGICLSHEITQLTKPERSGIEVGGDIGKLLPDRAERYPTILTLYLFYYFIEDRRCVGKRLEGLGGQGRILNCYCWTSKQILRVHEAAAGLPKALRRLLFPEAEDIDALFPDARSEPREIAVGRDEAKPIETATRAREA